MNIASTGKIAGAIVLCLLCFSSCTVASSGPGQPQIDKQKVKSQGFVTIDLEKAQAKAPYKDYLSLNPQGSVSLPFRIQHNSTAIQAYAVIDGQMAIQSKIDITPAFGRAQTGMLTTTFDKPGRYMMQVRACDRNNACTDSEPLKVTLFDTVPALSDDLPNHANPNNRKYINNTDAVIGTYFATWSVHNKKFDVSQVPLENLTHLMYAFPAICGGKDINNALKKRNPEGYDQLQAVCMGLPDFSVVIHDSLGEVAMMLPGQSGQSLLRGTLGQMMAAKRRTPKLKILASIGGATFSDPFFHLSDPQKRQVFMQSVAQFLRTWKFFDGIDVDWEYPGAQNRPDVGSPQQDGPTYVVLMKELRAMLDQVGQELGKNYELTSAIFSSPEKLKIVDYKEASQYIDYLFDMTYDFYGAWDLDALGHHTALYASDWRPTARNGNISIQTLLQQGVDPRKLVIGVAMYGRGWTGVTNQSSPGNPFSGKAKGPHQGQRARGVLNYKEIAQYMVGPNSTGINGYLTGYDHVAKAAYVFKANTGDLITYDNPHSVRAKSRYAFAYKLGGVFSWVIDGDNGDLLNAMHEGFGHPSIDQ
jgi:chitinase